MTGLTELYIQKMGDGDKSSASFARPADTAIYAANDVVATATTNLTFSDVMKTSENIFKVVGVTLEIDGTTIIADMAGFTLHLYDTAPTVIADNVAYNLPAGDRAKYLGYITLATPADLGVTLWSQNSTSMIGKLTSVSTSLYGILSTVGNFTPESETVFKVTIYTAAP